MLELAEHGRPFLYADGLPTCHTRLPLRVRQLNHMFLG